MRIAVTVVVLTALTLATASAAGAAAVSAASSCPSKCECKWRNGKESVLCPQMGLTEIPAFPVDSTVQVLDMSGNPLVQLGGHLFQRLRLLHLQRIVLQRCSMRLIERNAFMGLTNLVELDLSHNMLPSVPSAAFEHIPQLRELKLNGNPLMRLTNNALAAVSQLIRLEVANSQVGHVEARAFQGLELLEWLRLDGNLIESLPTATLSWLRSLKGVDLHHNPWNCTCTLRPIRAWLAARNMPFSVPPLCLWPERLRGKSWNRIPMEELACQPIVKAVDVLVQVHAGQSATLSCQVNANPEGTVQWFFGGRLITNITLSSRETGEADATSGSSNQQPQQQIYYLRESGTTDKTTHLTLASAREQDSGSYVCWVTNKADRISANVTLLVRPSTEAGGMGRGLIAGLIMGVFTFLVTCMLVCCFCSMKRARMHANLRNRRSSSAPPLSGQYDKSDLLLDPFIRRHNDDDKTNGALKPTSTVEPPRLGLPEQENTETTVGKRQRYPVEYEEESTQESAQRLLPPSDKQWLVSKEPPGSPVKRMRKPSPSTSMDKVHKKKPGSHASSNELNRALLREEIPVVVHDTPQFHRNYPDLVETTDRLRLEDESQSMLDGGEVLMGRPSSSAEGLERYPSPERYFRVERRLSIDPQSSVERHIPEYMNRRSSLDRHPLMDRRSSADRQNVTDRRTSVDRRSLVDRRLSLDRHPSVQRYLQRGSQEQLNKERSLRRKNGYGSVSSPGSTWTSGRHLSSDWDFSESVLDIEDIGCWPRSTVLDAAENSYVGGVGGAGGGGGSGLAGGGGVGGVTDDYATEDGYTTEDGYPCADSPTDAPSSEITGYPPSLLEPVDDEFHEVEVGDVRRITGIDPQFEKDFKRRYAYHTSQLNRYLTDYRSLQKRLSRMPDWSDQSSPIDAPASVPILIQGTTPLRPILKNRSSQRLDSIERDSSDPAIRHPSPSRSAHSPNRSTHSPSRYDSASDHYYS